MKKSDLIVALAAIPGDPEILVQSAEVGYDGLTKLSMITVQRLISDPYRLGSGDFVTARDITFLEQCFERTVSVEEPFEAIAIYRGWVKKA